jgi:hypothetical protein
MDPNTRALMMGAAGAGGGEKIYVEDVFSTYLYTGNGSTQTITNGIDLSGKGGLVWTKNRTDASNHFLFDSTRNNAYYLQSNSTTAQDTLGSGYNLVFNSNGFTDALVNQIYNGKGNASWTFRKAPKFFDVVTWTGDGTSSRNISHSLGSTPGFIIVKRTDSSSSWWCWHRSISTGDLSGNDLIVLNSTAAKTNIGTLIGTASSTVFQVGGDSSVNASGGTYVAYVFAHDAGGFGDTGNDSVIKCGSYTGNGSTSGPTIDLGWEPQWLLIKNATTAGNYWVMIDNMRGMSQTNNQWLYPNTSDAEGSTSLPVAPLATGFQVRSSGTFVNESGCNHIYIAIRRGPMKTPTDATNVFSLLSRAGTGAVAIVNGFTNLLDTLLVKGTASGGYPSMTWDRLRGPLIFLDTAGTSAEQTNANLLTGFDEQTGYKVGSDNGGYGINLIAGGPYVNLGFRRAPGFFDVVAYTGNGSYGAKSHNLGVPPELVITKVRSLSSEPWGVTTPTKAGNLNNTNAFSNYTSTFTSTTFDAAFDTNAATYIAYLFASCPGVSKVGSYTGTGTTLQINCGFTAGARFVMIKRTDSTGDWYYWNTARGIVSGNDPYLLLNSNAAEVTGTDYIDPLSSGFEISSTAPAAINANGGSFIFLAVA